MNRYLAWILMALAVAAQAATPPPATALQPAPAQAEAAEITAKLLSRYHYHPTELDDAMSSRILDRYLEALDPDKTFFTQADVKEFEAFRFKLDDAILHQDLGVPFRIFHRYAKRVQGRLADARGFLAKGFDFTRQESYRYIRADEPWAASEAELRDLWRQRVKNDWLRLKLAGKDDKSIRETLGKRYDTAVSRALRTNRDDVFQLFMNAYASAIEPHTSYLGARAAEDFAIAMKLSLVGIGAVLQERDDYIVIREVVPGGPAARSGQLQAGDRIVGVAQGKDGAMTDVLGWRVDEAVTLIRGDKGTTVVLDILPANAGPDGEHKRLALVRDKISLEKQAASKSVIDVGTADAPRRVGVITLPAFYQDSDARRDSDDFRSATRDVAKLVAELKADKVDALLIDLRNNGGGSLDEAVRLTGLFIDTGPVVQQRNAQGQVRVEHDAEAGVAWDGPLGVLINRASASASEIFAAAIQDYGRGVVIGERSFGKGTVQTLLSLDELVKSDTPKYGEVKLTIAEFFRVTGNSTQLHGVTPDIDLPSLLDAERIGESAFDNALAWSRIDAARFAPAGQVAEFVPALALRHQSRIAKDADYRYLLEDVVEMNALRNRKDISLNEAERRQERERQEARLKARDAALAKPGADATTPPPEAEAANPGDDGLLAGERSLAEELSSELAAAGKRDLLLEEASRIVGDLAELLQGTTTRTAGTTSRATEAAH
jgi:carboxyl-terminal processing protease